MPTTGSVADARPTPDFWDHAARRLRVLLVGSNHDPNRLKRCHAQNPFHSRVSKDHAASRRLSHEFASDQTKGVLPNGAVCQLVRHFHSCFDPELFRVRPEWTIESIAPVSTRNSDSNDRFGSTGLVSLVVTSVNPMAQKVPSGSTHRNGRDAASTAQVAFTKRFWNPLLHGILISLATSSKSPHTTRA